MKRSMIVGLLLLAGCTTPMMYTPRDGGAINPDQFRRDTYRCVQESRVNYQAGGYGLVGAAYVAAAGMQAQQQANQLMQLCMEAAGYRVASEEERAVTELGQRGLLPPAYLGINLSFVNQTATVTRVVAESPAAAAGLMIGDRIVRFDDQTIPDQVAFLGLLGRKQPGDHLALDVLRGDQPLRLEPVLRAR